MSPKFSSEMFARWKINTTSRYANHLYTLPQQSFWDVFWQFRSTVKRTPKSRMAIVKFIHFISQLKALYKDPCTLSSQKLVVFLLICGSSIARIKNIKLSHWHPEVNFESPVKIPLLLDKEAELSILSICFRIGWTQYFLSFSFF